LPVKLHQLIKQHELSEQKLGFVGFLLAGCVHIRGFAGLETLAGEVCQHTCFGETL